MKSPSSSSNDAFDCEFGGYGYTYSKLVTELGSNIKSLSQYVLVLLRLLVGSSHLFLQAA